MAQQVILIDNGSAEVVFLNAGRPSMRPDLEPTIRAADYKASEAQVWGFGPKGRKGINIAFDISTLPLKTLLTACFEPVWLRMYVDDAVKSVVREHTDPERHEDDGFTKEGVLEVASQFEEFAKRLRKAAK